MRIGIDVGGTKIEGIVLNNNNRILWRKRVGTPRDNYALLIKTIDDLVKAMSAENKLSQNLPIGLGIPGTLNSQHLMENCNSLLMNGKPFLNDLANTLNRPIKIANDANCFTLSEACIGSAQNFNSVFGVILGTGVGGGIVINKQLLNGPNQICGEWGHNLLPGLGTLFENENRLCQCGRLNCIETYLSGSGLSKTYQKISGSHLDAEKIAASAQNNPAAEEAINHFHQQLAYSLSQVINILDPSVIVLGGGLSQIESLYTEVPKLWRGAIYSDNIHTKLIKAEHGDSSGVFGAAYLN